MAAPIISNDPLYRMLYDENFSAFNDARKKGAVANLKGCDLRGLDLRTVNLEGLDLSDVYLRGCDLRGLDLRKCRLDGASMADAQISGCYFPVSIPATEIMLAIQHGTRIRQR